MSQCKDNSNLAMVVEGGGEGSGSSIQVKIFYSSVISVKFHGSFGISNG